MKKFFIEGLSYLDGELSPRFTLGKVVEVSQTVIMANSYFEAVVLLISIGHKNPVNHFLNHNRHIDT